MGVGPRHHGTTVRPAADGDQPFGLEHPQRLPERAAADTELLAHLPLRRQTRSGSQGVLEDRVGDRVGQQGGELAHLQLGEPNGRALSAGVLAGSRHRLRIAGGTVWYALLDHVERPSAQLPVIPARDPTGPELERHPLGGLTGRVLARPAVSRRKRFPDRKDELRLTADQRLRLDHDASQLPVDGTRLDLQRGPRVALEIAHLLTSCVGPGPDLRAPDYVPERHHLRPATETVARAGDGALLLEELEHLALVHADPPPLAANHAHGASISISVTMRDVVICEPVRTPVGA